MPLRARMRMIMAVLFIFAVTGADLFLILLAILRIVVTVHIVRLIQLLVNIWDLMMEKGLEIFLLERGSKSDVECVCSCKKL